MNRYSLKKALLCALITISLLAPSAEATPKAKRSGPARAAIKLDVNRQANEQRRVELYVRTELFFGSAKPDGTAVTFTGTFTDLAGTTHTASWAFDNVVATDPVTLTEPAGANPGLVSATHNFTAAGVYQVTVTVTNQCGGQEQASAIGVDQFSALVVVYDPSAGWVTGGGWINSPAGAYVPDPTLTGKANFGFVSKRQNGASVPTGNTEFHFKAGNLKFHSTSYEWMVIAGARAQYKGSGKINNAGDYRFILTAIDGQQPGGGGQDKFRIRIWNNAGGGLVYDNQLNAPDSADPTTLLGGGSIVIHR